MSKPFEVVYSPATWSTPPGGLAQQWSSPYGGLNVQTPENVIGPQYTPNVSNFIFRNSELRSRPRFLRYLPGPDGQNFILGCGSFLSRNSVWHTVAFTQNGLFQLQPASDVIVRGGGNPWARVGGPALSSGNVVQWRTFQGILYYTNNSGHLSAWDGAALTPISDVAFSGTTVPPPNTATTYGGLYLGELDNHIILSNCTEITNGILSVFPQRIRWSNNGFNPFNTAGTFGGNLGTAGATFDPAVNVNAGETDFLDVPDIITGHLFIGRMGYIFRQNGITEVAPTGQGTAPFSFNHLWASERGIGNIYPYSIAQYGNSGVFISTDQIYQITPSTTQPIGGSSRDAIMADLALVPNGQVPTGCITPAYSLGYVYLVYKLFIPTPSGDTVVYMYSFEDNNWTRLYISDTDVGVPNVCWVGASPASVTTRQVVSGVIPPPPSGGGGGAGGGGGQGGGCPSVDTWVTAELRACDIHSGTILHCMDGLDRPVLREPEISKDVECVRLSGGGAVLVTSWDTPVEVPGGAAVLAKDMDGKQWFTDIGWMACKVESVGKRDVVRIWLGGHSFGASERKGGLRGYTHNKPILG